MKSFTLSLYEFLFKLTVFLIPTQLAFHLWPSWSHIFGIRIDYLAPTLYLTDLMTLSLLVLGLFLGRISLRKIKTRWLVFAGVAFFILVNISQAAYPYPAIFKWLKIGEMAMFVWLTACEKKLNIKKWIIFPLSLSIVLFSLLGIFQFLEGHTLEGIFYLFGERSFSVVTPGISKLYLLGREYLRPYSTFSHPNSFAGFLGVSLLLLYFFGAKKGIILLGGLAFILTASLGAYVAMGVSLISLFLVNRKQRLFKRVVFPFVFLLIVASILSPVVYFLSPAYFQFSEESFYNRILLTQAAGAMISKSPAFGVGLNNFIVKLPSVGHAPGPAWFLQPVHNIFLLVFSETGLIGLLLFLYFLFLALKTSFSIGHWPFIIVFVFILTTGLVDHYWLTLQQNELLLSLVFGLSLRSDVKLCL